MLVAKQLCELVGSWFYTDHAKWRAKCPSGTPCPNNGTKIVILLFVYFLQPPHQCWFEVDLIISMLLSVLIDIVACHWLRGFRLLEWCEEYGGLKSCVWETQSIETQATVSWRELDNRGMGISETVARSKLQLGRLVNLKFCGTTSSRLKALLQCAWETKGKVRHFVYTRTIVYK